MFQLYLIQDSRTMFGTMLELNLIQDSWTMFGSPITLLAGQIAHYYQFICASFDQVNQRVQ
jgi:hypothetical protein